MLSQPQTRTLVNSSKYFYLITSCEEFNQNLEHSWGYGISLRSRDLSKILADDTHILTSVIGKCVAIDVYLSFQGTSNSTQYSLFYNFFFYKWRRWISSNWKFIFEPTIHFSSVLNHCWWLFMSPHQSFWIKRFYSSFIQRTHLKGDFSHLNVPYEGVFLFTRLSTIKL